MLKLDGCSEMFNDVLLCIVDYIKERQEFSFKNSQIDLSQKDLPKTRFPRKTQNTVGKENNDKDSDRTVQSNLSAREKQSGLAVSVYGRQYTIVLKDLLNKFDVTSATMPDTTGVTVLENPSKHVKGTSSVGNRHGLITVVGCSAEREEAWGDKEKSEYQQYLSSYERRIQSRLDSTNYKVKVTKGGNQKNTKKLKQ